MSAYTLEQLTAIKEALAEGTKIVRYQDKWIEYRSFDEMKQIIDLIENELGLKKRGGRVFGKFDKGTC